MQFPTLRNRVATERFQTVVNFVRFDTQSASECYERFYESIFFAETIVPFLRNQPDFISDRSQSNVGIILPQENPILGTRSEHTIRLIHPFGHQVVDQYPDVGFVACQYQRFLPHPAAMRIDTGHHPLRPGLFIAGRPVDLAGEIESVHQLGFERMVQLRRQEIVVLDRITRTENMQIFEPLDGVQCLPLNVPGQRRGEPVQIIFVGRTTLRLEKKLVLVLIGECVELVLDTRAITGTDPPDRTVEKRRIAETLPQNVMHLLRSIDQKARKLILHRMRIGRKREFRGIFIPVLRFQNFEIDRPRIESRRGPGLHPAGFETHRHERFGHSVRSRIPRTAALGVRTTAIHHPRQKRPGSQDHAVGRELHPHLCPNPAHLRPTLLRRLLPEEQFDRSVLPKIEVGGILQRTPPFGRETRLIALGPGTPHRRPFRAVEHAELDSRKVGNPPHLPSQSIYLSDYLTFSNTAYGRITRHIGQLGHVHRHEQRAGAEPRCRRSRLAAGMTAADHDDIVM